MLRGPTSFPKSLVGPLDVMPYASPYSICCLCGRFFSFPGEEISCSKEEAWFQRHCYRLTTLPFFIVQSLFEVRFVRVRLADAMHTGGRRQAKGWDQFERTEYQKGPSDLQMLWSGNDGQGDRKGIVGQLGMPFMVRVHIARPPNPYPCSYVPK